MHLFIYASFIITAFSQFTLSPPTKSYSSNLTLVQNVSYQLNFTLNKYIPSGSSIILTFGSQFRIPSSTLSNCKASISSSASPVVAACSSVYSSGLDCYSIVYTDVYGTAGTQTFLWLNFMINNPWGQTSSRVDIYIKDISSNTLQSVTFFIDYYASIMTGCSFQGVTNITGDNVGQIVKFTPSRDLIASSYLVISLPFWFVGSLINVSSTTASSITCTGLQNSDSSSLACTLGNNSNSNQIININNFVNSNKTSPGEIQIQVDTLKNPWSTQSFGQIIFQIYYIGVAVTQKCSGIYETVTQPNQFKFYSLNLTNLAISANSTGLQLILAIQNPNPKNQTRLRIEYSSDISITWSGTGPTVFSQSSTQMILTNIVTTTDKTTGSISLIGLSIVTPPSTRPFTFKYTSQYITASNNVYDIDTYSKTYTNNAGVINSVNVTATDPTINVITSYKIDFILTNKMTNGGFIQIIFPSTLAIDASATCSDNVLNSSTCTIASGNLTININGSLGLATSFSVTVDKVKNSAQSIQSQSFKIYSYYDSLYNSLIDKIQSGINATMIANQLSTVVITPNNLTTYIVTSYKFDIPLKDSIAQNGYIQIQFPAEVVPISGSLAITASTFSASTCGLILNGQILKLLNCFLSGPMTTLSTSITIGGIRNPQSYKRSDTFKIKTYSGLPSLTNYLLLGLTVQMDTAYVLTTLTITPQSSVVHTDTKQTIDIVHTIPLAINDYILINFDSTMMISTSVSCSALLGVTGINCTRMSNYQIKFIYTTGISSQTLRYDLTSVMNYDIGQITINFDATVYTTDNFIKQKALTTYTYQQATITTLSINNDDKIILYDYSEITLILTTPFIIGSTFDPTKTMIEIILPVGITTASNTTCSVLFGTCTIPLNTKIQINSIGLGVSSYSVVLTNILLPFISVQSNSFSITFYYNGNKVSAVTNGVVIKPYCTSPCKACSLLKTKCLNCLPTPNNFIYFNPSTFTCLTICADGTYSDPSLICQNCTSPCVNCLDTSKCLSCVAGTWLQGQACVNSCPDFYYNGASGVCLNCQDPCNKCQSQTSCLTCKTEYLFNFTCVTAANCPSGTYANSDTLSCDSCQMPCATCTHLASNCTACVNSYFFYNETCINACPDGTYQSGNICVGCTGLCNTCQNNSYCLSCTSNYYYNGTCLTESNCPVGTYPNITQMKCKTCPAGCTSCDSISHCTACDITFYIFYQFQCITNCPDGTYKSGFTCQNCQSPCQNCQNTSLSCLSCTGGNYLYLNSCLSSCPRGFYEDINICKSCKPQCADCSNGSSCIQCSGSLYLTISGQCLSNCPSTYYQNSLTNKCQLCASPCYQCSHQPTNCTSCISSNVLYQNDCSSSSCPSQYFNVSGVCKTCSNCNNCINADKCDSCRAGYFIFAGLCYSSCPATAPIQDLLNQACTLCDSTCQGCAVSAKNCTSCNTGQYLFNSGCFGSCPSGYVQNIYEKSCVPKQISSIFFFPALFASLAILAVLIYSKYMYNQTQFFTVFTAVVSVFCFVSWIIFFIIMNFFESTLKKQTITSIATITIIVIGLSIIQGFGYQIYLICTYNTDGGFLSWKQHSETNSKIHKVIVLGSLINFIFYRFLYGRLFHRQYFSLYYDTGDKLLTHTHRLALFTIIMQILPMVGISFYTIYSKELYDQTVYSALDTLVINVILIILLLIQGSKNGQQFFGQIRKKFPFILSQTKGKYLQVDSSMSIVDLEDYEIEKQKRIKTQIAEKQKQNYFRRITCIQNLNKFGHLNQVTPNKEQQTKTLPQFRQFGKFPQFNMNQQDEIQVMDDLFFQQKEEDELNYIKQKQRLQIQRIQKQKFQAQLQRYEQTQQQEQKLKKIQQVQNKKKMQQKLRIEKQIKQEQQRIEQQRLAKLLEDQLQQQNLQCVDIAAIDKAESKNKSKKSPLDFLSKCKTVDEKPIEQKASKKLQDIAKKNGIDPEFMKQTFGVQKYHNQQLLNSIIDKHHHVNRQAVKQMFKQTNNKEVLQQLFSKNSTIDTEKLKQIMNDKDGINMIEKLMDQQKGIVSADIAKVLLDKNSKFKPEFTKKLLSGQTGADQKKLQSLLRDAQSQKAKQQNLKALKKIGGQNLQNTELIQKMLGQDSKLDPNQFTKVAMSLSSKALQSIFTNKSPQNKKLVDKILNNKKLNLSSMAPIFQDQELIYELGKKLGGDDPILQENVMNLLKNCGEGTDPQKLKEFLQNQVLVRKLMTNSVIDPQFLTEILNKDSKANIDLIEKTLNDMPDEDIQKVFQFTGNKNIDYKSLSKIFQQNDKTDPELVKNMLDPELIEEVFTKNNNVNSNMLQKLVEKGSKFDKDNIVSIYGKNTDNVFGNQFPNQFGNNLGNITDGNFQQQGLITNKIKNRQQARKESIVESIKNGSFTEMIKNQSFAELIKNGALTEILKGGSPQEFLKSQSLQQMINNGSFNQIIKKASNGQSIKNGPNGQIIKFGSNGQITKIGSKGQSISIDSKGDTIIIGSNGQTIKIGQNGNITVIGAKGQILKNGNYQQLMNDGGLQEMINNGLFGQMIKNGPIGQMIKNGTFGEVIKNGNLGQTIKKQSYKQIIKNGKFTQILKNGPIGQIIMNQQIQESIRNGTYEQILKNGGAQFQSLKSGGTSFYNPQANQTQYDFKMNFNKTANQNFNLSQNGQIRPQQMDQMIMSRTDGGIMGFLNPLKLKEKKKKLKASMKQKDEWDDLGQKLQDDDQDGDDYEYDEQGIGSDKAILQQEDEDQFGYGQNRRRKAPIKKRKLKKITDIRHPAEKIYLEPILAPHQIQQNKNFRKKKKRDSSQSATKLIMDEDNDVFDIDF